MTATSPIHCRSIVPLLRSRDGQKTKCMLAGDRTLSVFNIAWGDDIGEAYEHLTSNCSPILDGMSIDLFFTDEVVKIVDPESGSILWATDGIPNVR